MFTLTARAAEQILLAAHNQPDTADPPQLRIAAKYGDDCEIVYGMGFDEAGDGELPSLQADGVTVLIATPSLPLLQGTQLDFVELNPGEFSFIFIPQSAAPRAQADCGSGCGGGCASRGIR